MMTSGVNTLERRSAPNCSCSHLRRAGVTTSLKDMAGHSGNLKVELDLPTVFGNIGPFVHLLAVACTLHDGSNRLLLSWFCFAILS
eukprot:3698808-Amphidinium_carterae.1